MSELFKPQIKLFGDLDVFGREIARYTNQERRAYTPVLTAATADPNLGSGGVIEGFYSLNGREVFGMAKFSWNGSSKSAGTGAYRLTMPLPMKARLTAGIEIAGHGVVSDVSAFDVKFIQPYRFSSTQVQFLLHNSLVVTDAAPYAAWAADDDYLSISFQYEWDTDA